MAMVTIIRSSPNIPVHEYDIYVHRDHFRDELGDEIYDSENHDLYSLPSAQVHMCCAASVPCSC